MPGSPRRIPLLFKVDVPRQGNYKVTLTIRSEEEMGEVLIFTGRRRLAFRGRVQAGEFTYTMAVNVCDIVPVGYSHIFADKTVDIAVLADRPRISALTVEEMNCPTVYLAGDSTVTDQPGDYPYYPGTCYCGTDASGISGCQTFRVEPFSFGIDHRYVPQGGTLCGDRTVQQTRRLCILPVRSQ